MAGGRVAQIKSWQTQRRRREIFVENQTNKFKLRRSGIFRRTVTCNNFSWLVSCVVV